MVFYDMLLPHTIIISTAKVSCLASLLHDTRYLWAGRKTDDQITALQAGTNVLKFGSLWHNDCLGVPFLLTLADDRVLQDLVRHGGRTPSYNEVILMEIDVERILEDIWDIDRCCGSSPVVGSLDLYLWPGI